ncbi:MAG: CTP synthase [Planctomycetota bacterium]
MAPKGTKHIFVTGGVVSSLGKGLTSAAIAMLLESRGLRVGLQKLDPYINVDPGTMSPFQHGEVYVLDDGAETDLDLGHYERFTHAKLNRHSNYTTGKIYHAVITKERAGAYLGSTVQVIPHVTDEIKESILRAVDPHLDVLITEIGGTVGDIESLPFLEAIRQFRHDRGSRNVFYVHLTLLPYLRAAGELKTKPTQQSVSQLRQIGIQPDCVICRTERPMTQEIQEKISLFTNVDRETVIEERDVEYSIYEVPIVLQQQKLDEIIIDRLSLDAGPSNLSDWKSMLAIVRNPERETRIAVVGKYIQLTDAYKSIYEALAHAGIANKTRVRIEKIEAEDIEAHGPARYLEGVGGILVPGGFGERGTDGKIDAVRYARENKIPFFGICLGLQSAVIEFARNVAKLQGANSTEFDSQTPHPVIALMEDQRDVRDKGGTMRLGSYPCTLAEGLKAFEAYGERVIFERHRHRFEVNNLYRERLVAAGLKISGVYEKGDLVEIVEIEDHPFFVGVQYHPEFKSKPTAAHPLFRTFVRAALETRATSVATDDEDAETVSPNVEEGADHAKTH